jgi:hypothetical protein
MKLLELQLPEQTASKLQEAAERLSVSPEQLSILTIEEKLAQIEVNSVTQLSTCSKRTLTSIDGLPDALLISSGSHLATFPFNRTKCRQLWLGRTAKRTSWSTGNHFLKVGARLRHAKIDNMSAANCGRYVFRVRRGRIENQEWVA